MTLIQEYFTTNAGTVAVSLFIFMLAYLYLRDRKRNLPPGPPAFPVIGSLPFLGQPKDILKTLDNMARRYGNVFSFYMGNRLVVILHGFETISTALVDHKDSFSGRPQLYVMDIMKKQHGLIVTSGDSWKEQRQFVVKTIRELGVGNKRMEEAMQEECTSLLTEFRESDRKAINPFNLIAPAALNILARVLFGKRFPYGDPAIQKYIKALNENIKVLGFSSIINYIPVLQHIPGDFFKINAACRRFKTCNVAFIEQQIEEHKQTYDPEYQRDLTDAYIKELQKDDAEQRYFSEFQLIMILSDLIAAGYETVPSSITFLLLYAVLYPDMQCKIQREIDDVIGPERSPCYADKERLPYTDAYIHEVMRFCSVSPLTVPHATTSDVVLNGYNIPEGTIIWPMLLSSHADTEYFKEPEKFNPSRFLNDQGIVQTTEAYIPFGTGPRSCAGQPLARMEMFIFFTTLLQKFTFTLPEGITSVDPKPYFGIIHMPKPFKLCAQLRS